MIKASLVRIGSELPPMLLAIEERGGKYVSKVSGPRHIHRYPLYAQMVDLVGNTESRVSLKEEKVADAKGPMLHDGRSGTSRGTCNTEFAVAL